MISLFQRTRVVSGCTAQHRTTLPSASDDDDVGGCGWFDSSHELRQGLWVQEHLATDSLPAEMPLADWLTLHLWSNPVTLVS